MCQHRKLSKTLRGFNQKQAPSDTSKMTIFTSIHAIFFRGNLVLVHICWGSMPSK
jgi:hypothetical protein